MNEDEINKNFYHMDYADLDVPDDKDEVHIVNQINDKKKAIKSMEIVRKKFV